MKSFQFCSVDVFEPNMMGLHNVLTSKLKHFKDPLNRYYNFSLKRDLEY